MIRFVPALITLSVILLAEKKFSDLAMKYICDPKILCISRQDLFIFLYNFSHCRERKPVNYAEIAEFAADGKASRLFIILQFSLSLIILLMKNCMLALCV